MNNKYIDIIETLWLTEHIGLYTDSNEMESCIKSIVELTPFLLIGLNNEITEASDQVEGRLDLINDVQNAINIIDDRKASWGVY